MKFYKKELLSNRLALPNGKGVKFEQVGDSDTGVMATDDAGLIAELDKAAAAGRGGVVVIDEPQYQELKKNPPVAPSRIRSLNAQSIQQLLRTQNRAGAAPAAVAANQIPSAPMEVPKGVATVSQRRQLRELVAESETTGGTGGSKPESKPAQPPTLPQARPPAPPSPTPAPAPAPAPAKASPAPKSAPQAAK